MKQKEKRARERQRDLPFSDSALNGCSDQSWANMKPGAWDPTQVSHVDGRARALWLSSVAFPGDFQGAGSEAENLGLTPHAVA